MKINCELTDGTVKTITGDTYYVNLFHPLSMYQKFLPRALQPTPVSGRAGTTNPVKLHYSEASLLYRYNPDPRSTNWLIKNVPGWLHKFGTDNQYPVLWQSAVALAGNFVLVTRIIGNWAKVSGIPYNAKMTFENILNPFWIHRVYVASAFSDYNDVIRGVATYSLVWDRYNRPNIYPDGSLWINLGYITKID
jgi:hypothetical protein